LRYNPVTVTSSYIYEHGWSPVTAEAVVFVVDIVAVVQVFHKS